MRKRKVRQTLPYKHQGHWVKAVEGGDCSLCGRPYETGDKIATLIVNKKHKVSHSRCLYEKVKGRCLLSENGVRCMDDAALDRSYCDKHLTQRLREQEQRRLERGLPAPSRPEPVQPREVVSTPPRRTEKQKKRVQRQCVVVTDGVQCPHLEFANFMFCDAHMKVRKEIKAAMNRG